MNERRYECPFCLRNIVGGLVGLWEHEQSFHKPASLAESMFDYAPTGPGGVPIFDSGFTHGRRERYHAEGNTGSSAVDFIEWIVRTEADRSGRYPGESGYKYPVPACVSDYGKYVPPITRPPFVLTNADGKVW